MTGDVRAYMNAWYLIAHNERSRENCLILIEFLKCALKSKYVDDVVCTMIQQLSHWKLFGDDTAVVVLCLNDMRSDRYDYCCCDIIEAILERDENDRPFLSFDVCVKLLTQCSMMKPRLLVCGYTANSLTSPIIHYYSRYSVQFMKQYGQYYSSLVMHIYAGDIWEIFKQWARFWKFRRRNHALVLYICEHMTLDIMRQLNQHIDDFIDMLRSYSPSRHDLNTIEIYRMLVAHGLDIFRKRPDGVCLYELMKYQNGGLRSIVDNF